MYGFCSNILGVHRPIPRSNIEDFRMMTALTKKGFVAHQHDEAKHLQASTTAQDLDLKQAERALRESEQRYRSVVENIGIGVSLISPNMEILALNRQMKTWFPWIDERQRPICYRSFNDPPRNKVCSYCPTRKTLLDGDTHEAISETPRGGMFRQYRIVSSPIKDKDGGVVSAIEMVEDITERRLTEEKLRASEERFRQLSEASFEAIAIHDGGVLLRANEQYFSMFDFQPEELLGRQVLPLTVAPEFIQTVKERIASCSTDTYEFVALRKDGTRFSVESRIRTMDYEGREARVAVMRDVTARKRYEEQLFAHRAKLRSLATELSLAKERQRRRIAAEVHDHLGQDLAFAKIKVAELRTYCVSENAFNVLNNVAELVDKSIEDVRALVSELGSPVLYELGFVAAVEWVAQRTANRHGITVGFEKERIPKTLPQELEVLLFEAVRELLANVVKHSQAQEAQVRISANDDRLIVRVRDQGRGFDATNLQLHVTQGNGFGLFSIQERLEPCGCTMDVESEPGRGTQVTLTAPFR